MKTFLTALYHDTYRQHLSIPQNLTPQQRTTHHVGILELLEHLDVVELDVEVLIDALEDAADLDVVLELDRDLVVDEGLEEAVVCVRVSLGSRRTEEWGGLWLMVWRGNG